jgi:hypothetical protein
MVCPSAGRLTRIVVTLASLATACGGTSPAATAACDPLATTTLPISAGKLIAAGKDAAGTVYLIDEFTSPEGAGIDRLFISSGTVLQRQVVDGSGSNGSGAGAFFIISTGSAGAQALQVEVEMGPSGPAKMAIHHGPLSGKTFAIDADGEPLALLSQADLAAFSLQNLPGTIVAEHHALLADGRVVLVTRPAVDASYQDFRVFFGPVDHLQEGTDVHVSRGSYTQITFTWDGRPVQAVFGSPLAPAIVSALTIDGQTLPLTVAAAGSAPAHATFFCMPLK